MSILKSSKYYLFICCLFLFQTSVVKADDWQEDLSVDVFFSLDASIADSGLSLVGGTGPVDLEADEVNLKNSLVGGQIRYQLTENLSGYVQGSVINTDKVKGTVDWAYLSYDFGNDVFARVGRFQIPFLQGTELRKIGFSRIWARPLIPGTGAGGFNQYEGVEVVKKIIQGDGLWEFQGALGKAEHTREEVQNKNIKLLSTRYQNGQFWIRAAVMNGDYSIFTLSEILISDTASINMGSLESELTLDSWIVNVGYSRSNSDITPDDTMHYGSLAYQIGDVTPFIFFSKREQSFESFEIPRPNPGNGLLPPPNAPPPVTNGPPPTPDGLSTTYTSAIGARWDVAENLALKFQAEKSRVQDQARQGDGNLSNAGNTFSVVLEGVF